MPLGEIQESELWRQVKPLFEAALELPQEAREQFVQARTAGQPEAANRLRSMLAAHESEGTLLDRSLPDRIQSLPEPSEDSLAAAPGWVVGGRYRLVRELGRGGNGYVWEAQDESVFGRAVAVKILRRGALGRAFDTELKALALLNHGSIAVPTDSGFLDDGRRFLVIEYVSGPSLREMLERGPLEPMRACHILRQIAQALDSAHKRGVWHLDLKPENVMIRDAGEGGEQAVLVDFGISRLAGASLEDASPPAGSMAYAAPEQLGGEPCGASDQYSLARMAVEMVTGHKPKPLEPAEALLARCGALRHSVTAIFRRALSTRPLSRYSSASQFIADLEAALDPARLEVRRFRLLAAASCFLLFGALAIYIWLNRERERAMIQSELESTSAQIGMVSTLLEAGRLDHKMLGDTVRGVIRRLKHLVDAGRRNPEILSRLLDAQLRFGLMYGHPGIPHLGSVESGIANYEDALKTLELLYTGRLKDDEYARWLISVRDGLASNLVEAGRFGRAAELSEESLVIIGRREALGWPAAAANEARATVMLTLSRVRFHRAEWEQCAALRSEAVRLKRIAAAAGQDASKLKDLAGALAARGHVYREMGRYQQALADYQESQAIVSRLLENEGGNLGLEWLDAKNKLELGKTMLFSGAVREAETLLWRAVATHRSLLESAPQAVSIQRTLALSLSWIAVAHHRLHRPAGVWRKTHLEAWHIAEAALRRDPLNAKARSEAAVIRKHALSCGVNLPPLPDLPAPSS